MSLMFASDEWAKALHTELNGSAAYQDAAKKWEGDLCFEVLAGGGLEKNAYLYMDLWHGECRSAYASDEPMDAAFTLSAPLGQWKEIVDGRLDPIKAITSRKLKLKGPLIKIMKAPKAAIELVNCAKALDTAWPGA